jgi:hypothetical protein
LTVGAHTLSFNTNPGWTTPSSQMVAISNSQTTLAAGTYLLQTGSLQMTILPPAVVAAGAKWQVDGGTLQAGGVTLSGLLPGSHTVGFSTVLGWVTPSNQVVTVTNALTTSAATTYFNYSDLPQLSGMTVRPGAVQLVLNGAAGSICVIEASSNLASWSPVFTNTVPAAGSMLLNDPGAAGQKQRFYRAVISQ